MSFGKSDFVMRARENVYHIDCFRCVACSRQLIPGDEFALKDDELFCKADHDVVERSSSTKENGNGSSAEEDSPKSSKIRKLSNSNNDDNNNNSDIQKGGLHLAGRCQKSDVRALWKSFQWACYIYKKMFEIFQTIVW